MPTKTIAAWVDALQARGRYTFLRQEAIVGSGVTREAAKKALQRLVGRGRVAKVNDSFYVVVPLEYRAIGAPPPSWFISDFMATMKRPYYVGLLSAAALHGASHQQPQEFQVMTSRSIRSLQVGRARIRFFVNKHVLDTPITTIKTPTGAMRVSSPEATALDLVRYAWASGQLDHVATVISELAPRMDSRKIVDVMRRTGDLPNAQRLGYVLEQVRAKQLAQALWKWVRCQQPHRIPLRPGRNSLRAPEDRRWHVAVSQPLEIER